TVQACTPHILPGVYDNRGEAIRRAVAALQEALDREGIGLRLVPGADGHLVPGLGEGLRSGGVLARADSRYVLVEPPDRLPPARLAEQFFGLMVAGYHPIFTPPERLGWVFPAFGVVGGVDAGDGGVADGRVRAAGALLGRAAAGRGQGACAGLGRPRCWTPSA